MIDGLAMAWEEKNRIAASRFEPLALRDSHKTPGQQAAGFS
jgi:hypothetical protein